MIASDLRNKKYFNLCGILDIQRYEVREGLQAVESDRKSPLVSFFSIGIRNIRVPAGRHSTSAACGVLLYWRTVHRIYEILLYE